MNNQLWKTIKKARTEVKIHISDITVYVRETQNVDACHIPAVKLAPTRTVRDQGFAFHRVGFFAQRDWKQINNRYCV